MTERSAAAPTGSAGIQATLWSQHAEDWADVMEGWNGWGIPVYRKVLERIGVGAETALLDVGCGAGRFCRMAADRGAHCAGLDATDAFVEIARERVRGADFRVGDMEALPWPDDSFDVVTGFNSFFIAADMGAALSEARRVLRPGGSLAMTVFGRPERRDSTDVFAAAARLMPDAGGRRDEGPQLHDNGVLEDVVAAAGLRPREAGYFEFVEEYPDLATVLRGMMAAPPFVRAAQAAGDAAVREALAKALEARATVDGRYRMVEELRYVIATRES